MDDNKIKNYPSSETGIVVDDGSVTEFIRNKRGEVIGEFTFYPHDFGIVDRYNKAVADLDKITDPLKSVNINAHGEADDADGLDALREAERRLYDACDYIFGGNMSEAFFGKLHPFSPINGRFYCENALEALGTYISRRFDREVQKVNGRVEKYTRSYQSVPNPHGHRSGKHKGGGKRWK